MNTEHTKHEVKPEHTVNHLSPEEKAKHHEKAKTEHPVEHHLKKI